MKNYIKIVLICVLFLVLGLFAKDTYKKQETEIKELKQERTVLLKKVDTLYKEKIKLEYNLTNLQNLEIKETKNADGSSTKTVKKSSSKNVNTKIEQEKKIEVQEQEKKDTKIEEQKEVKEKVIEKKTSALKPILWIAGGVLVCILSGVCIF